jgi:hypothetical protein
MNSPRGPLRKRESSLWEREQHDWYQEPSWVSARLFEEEPFRGEICDVACGGGNIVKSAARAGFRAKAMDLMRRTDEIIVQEQDWLSYDDRSFDNIVSNPPFKLCDDRKAKSHPFVEKCLAKADRKVALLLPANWVQGDMRSRWLQASPLRRVWFISPRPSMPPGHVIAAGMKPGNGTTDYAWFVWQHDYDGPPEVRWLRRNGDNKFEGVPVQ